MRLVNVKTLNYEEFDDESACPKYAILSHRWQRDEVTYQDGLLPGLDRIHKKGVEKIKQCCKLALEHDLQYIWVDTCCIDKSSSAELSEAINSMFRWYQLGKICFAHLSDIEVGRAVELSLWFSRAWTLQELIAPHQLQFYSKDWQPLGSKSELADVISARTGIPQDVLRYKVNIYNLPVAQRMSWARRRKSRRVEDIAYSLLGIFDVNMPLLYGEGKKAFRRLQEEIIKQNNDQTIFLWSATAKDVGKLLAPSPDGFDPNKIFHFKPSRKGKKPFSVTNLGLSITLPLIPWHAKTYLALLDCEAASSGTLDGWHQPGLYLRQRRDSDLFEKINFSARDYGFLQNYNPNWRQTRDIHIALDTSTNARDSTKPHDAILRSNTQTPDDDELYGFVIRSAEVRSGNKITDILSQSQVSTQHQWDSSTGVLEMQPGTAGDAAIIRLPENPGIPAGVDAIKLGFDFDFHPCCVISGIGNSRVQGQQRLLDHSVDPVALVANVDLSREQDWFNFQNSHVVPVSAQGHWLLKGDLQLGLSVLLGPPTYVGQQNRDFCISRRQVSVRLTREQVKNRTAWVFDLRISACPGSFCQSHKQERNLPIISPPEIIVSPPGLSPWSP